MQLHVGITIHTCPNTSSYTSPSCCLYLRRQMQRPGSMYCTASPSYRHMYILLNACTPSLPKINTADTCPACRYLAAKQLLNSPAHLQLPDRVLCACQVCLLRYCAPHSPTSCALPSAGLENKQCWRD